MLAFLDDKTSLFYLENIRGLFPGETVLISNLYIGKFGKRQSTLLTKISLFNEKEILVIFPSKALKHIHEKRPAWAFDIITIKYKEILLYPDSIHINKTEDFLYRL